MAEHRATPAAHAPALAVAIAAAVLLVACGDTLDLSLTPSSVAAARSAATTFTVSGLRPQAYLANAGNTLRLVDDLRVQIGTQRFVLATADGAGLTGTLAAPLSAGDYDLTVHARGVDYVRARALHVYAAEMPDATTQGDARSDAPAADTGADATTESGTVDARADTVVADRSPDATIEGGLVEAGVDASAGIDAVADAACAAAVCSGVCTDLASDPSNCGRCGVACAAGSACTAGLCCPRGQTNCGGLCVDLQRSDTSCGACGNACSGATRCVGGACVCPSGEALCSGRCVAVAVDPANCGRCGNACPAGQYCVSNACVTACPGALLACGGTCVDRNTDSNNCDMCGNACAAGGGCVDHQCQAAVSLGPAPARCTNGGPLLAIEDGASARCPGEMQALASTFGLCSCGDAPLRTIVVDGFDNRLGINAAPRGGGGVAVDGANTFNSLAVSGDLWTGVSGLSLTGACFVGQALHDSGPLNVSNTFVVGGAGFVTGPYNIPGMVSFGQTLTTPSCAAVPPQVSHPSCANAPISTAPPCDCSPGALVPIASIIAHYVAPANNDNAAVRLSPAALANVPGAVRLDLPCGYYALDRIESLGSVVLAAHGRTALFIRGGVDVSQLSVIADPGTTFDVFVGGTLRAGVLNVGIQTHPNSVRVYVGGVCAAAAAACSQNGDCCSQSCSAGTCASGGSGAPFAVSISSASEIDGLLYAPRGSLLAGGAVTSYGSLFVGSVAALQGRLHFDRAAPVTALDCAPAATRSCTSCRDCDNQACVGGRCGACATNADCCAPLRCSAGVCAIAASGP